MPSFARWAIAPLLLFCSLTAQAQEWPTRQLTIVVPFPPGGSVDTMTRLI